MEAEIGIIGGSGIYSLDLIKDPEEKKIETPYGKSPQVILGEVEDQKVAFLPRHGGEHSLPPHKINFRANIWSLKELGIKRIIATTAVGSLSENIEPGDFVLLDQFIDFTKNRTYTFYEGGDGEVFHVDMTEPYCPEVREILMENAEGMDINLHKKGTYACTEGPRYETAAEVRMLEKLNGDVVGMTNVPECVLARELEICYSAVSVVTNFGAGISEEKLTHEEVKEIMEENTEGVKNLIFSTIPDMPEGRNCPCENALEGAKVEP